MSKHSCFSQMGDCGRSFFVVEPEEHYRQPPEYWMGLV